METLSKVFKIFLADHFRKTLSDHEFLADHNLIDSRDSSKTCYVNHSITEYPEEGLDQEGNSPLHLACRVGSFMAVKKIIDDGDIKKKKKKLCFVKDKDGYTPLHIAAMKGRVDVLQLLVEACPDSVKEVNAGGETCLHTAVVCNKGKTIQFLLTWLARKKSDYSNLINAKNYEGNTPLHLATSRRQLQTLKVLLTCDPDVRKLVQVNAMNCSGLTALDILFVLPHSGKIDLEIEKLLRKAGGLRAKNNSNSDDNIFPGKSLQKRNSFARSGRSCSRKIIDAQDILLVTATLIATLTFQAAISFPSIMSKEISRNDMVYLNQGNSITTRSFVLFNSTGFIASICIIIFLLNQLPMKPWPQISVSTLFGSYMCIINVISPRQALPLLSLSIPFLLLAAAGKFFGFHDRGSFM